jgi:TonB family protein
MQWQRVGSAPGSEVMIKFKLDRLGHVLSASVVKGSGDAAYDQAALAMMHRRSGAGAAAAARRRRRARFHFARHIPGEVTRHCEGDPSGAPRRGRLFARLK